METYTYRAPAREIQPSAVSMRSVAPTIQYVRNPSMILCFTYVQMKSERGFIDPIEGYIKLDQCLSILFSL